MAFPQILNARPRRAAVIRTRRGFEEVLEILRRFVEAAAGEGFDHLASYGYVTSGSVGKREFLLDYYFNNPRNPQNYTVRGAIRDATDWRVIRLSIEADAAWLGVTSLAVMIGYLAYSVALGRFSLRASVWLFAFGVMGAAFANILWIPDRVTNQVAYHLARELHGSVLERGGWVVQPEVPEA